MSFYRRSSAAENLKEIEAVELRVGSRVAVFRGRRSTFLNVSDFYINYFARPTTTSD